MSEKLGWQIHEVVGMGIVNARALLPELKGWARLYRDILEFGHSVVIKEINEDDGIYVIETYKKGSSYWNCNHVLAPGKQIEQLEK